MFSFLEIFMKLWGAPFNWIRMEDFENTVTLPNMGGPLACALVNVAGYQHFYKEK